MEDILISANGFIEDLKTEYVNLMMDGLRGSPRPSELSFQDVIDRLNEQPTVDAVEVVRCKDCKYSEPIFWKQYSSMPHTVIWCSLHQCAHPNSYFCADEKEGE